MFLVGILLGLVAGYVIVTLFRRNRPVPQPTEIEFWVYLPTDKMPSQDDLMTDLSKAAALGPPELLLFSDIRLHMALALREKNPEQFRPDLLDPHVTPTAETLQALAESIALARVRFASDHPVPNDRHLRLVPYLAFAIAKRSGANLVLDHSASRLMTMSDYEGILQRDRRLEEPLNQVSVFWQPIEAEGGGQAVTRGLGKRGKPDLRTLAVMQDQRLLAVELLEEAVKQLWTTEVWPSSVVVNAHEDEFDLELSPPKDGIALVRIKRIQNL